MATETKPVTSCKRHSPQYKAEVLALAERVGVPAAAIQLGLHECRLNSWRVKNRFNEERSAVEERLALENARLKRQLAVSAQRRLKHNKPLNRVSAPGGQDRTED